MHPYKTRKGCHPDNLNLFLTLNLIPWKTHCKYKVFFYAIQHIIQENLKEAYEKGDLVVIESIERAAKYLGVGVANLINIFEPEAIGIGGSFVYFEEVLLNRLKTEIISKNILFNPRENIIVKTAILENDAVIIGATL